MSLILDALNRSRAEANPVPGLATHHPVEQLAVNRWQYLLWVALSVAVVVIAWLAVERYSAPQFPAPEIVADVLERSLPGDNIPDGTADLSEIVVTADHIVQAEVTSAQAAEDAIPLVDDPVSAAPALPAEPSRLPPPNDAVAELYRNPDHAEVVEPRLTARQSSAAPAPHRTEQPVDVEEILRRANEETRNAKLADHPVPFLVDLSQQTKDTIPTVYYLRHDYSSDASRSTVVLNSKTLSVGGSPAAGMKVEEILPDSVVLNYQGTQFRLRALNSWVNL